MPHGDVLRAGKGGGGTRSFLPLPLQPDLSLSPVLWSCLHVHWTKKIILPVSLVRGKVSCGERISSRKLQHSLCVVLHRISAMVFCKSLWEVCRGGLEVWEQERGFSWFDSLILPCWYLSSALIQGPDVNSCLSGFL